VKLLFGFIAVFVALFFLLGLKSQKGKAPGLIDGKPERATTPLKASRTALKDAIKATGGTITSDSEEYISATYMSSIFKFVDDVELRPAGDGHWHIRSASRVGYSDRGVNRRRVEIIRNALSQ